MARVALVSGGTRGIGAAIAKALKAAGYKVAANYGGNDEAANAFKNETGIPVFKWDVSDYDSCAAGIAKVEADLGPIEILENNFEEQEIILAGINNTGMGFARMILEELQKITDIHLTLTRIRLNPAAPLSQEVSVEMPLEGLNGKAIIVIDDVANTGRTIFYAVKPILDILPKKVEVAVLVNRTHKSFPIMVDYVGLSLATTLMDDIDVQIQDVEELAVYLN